MEVVLDALMISWRHKPEVICVFVSRDHLYGTLRFSVQRENSIVMLMEAKPHHCALLAVSSSNITAINLTAMHDFIFKIW